MGQVISLGAVPGPEPGRPKRAWGAVRTYKGSSNLYVRFPYLGGRVEKATGLPDTPENRRKVRAFLDACRKRIEEGSFRFAEAFPGAAEEEKARFARLESPGAPVLPEQVVFGEYLERWMQTNPSTHWSPSKRRDYEEVIGSHLRDYFGPMTFGEFNGVALVRFVAELRKRRGRSAGLSTSRIRNILTPLRIIWEDACEEHRWELRSPFEHLKRRNADRRLIPNRRKNPPEVFRSAEWRAVIAAIQPWYRPIAELMVLTGAIASEAARLTPADIKEDVLHIPGTKTEHRDRSVPLTPAVRRVLAELLPRAQSGRMVRLHTGKPFDASRFQKDIWAAALAKAGVGYRRPYATRHTFACWSLMAGVHPTKLASLMGHSSKHMVYETYGPYTEGLEDDTAWICCYLLGAGEGDAPGYSDA